MSSPDDDESAPPSDGLPLHPSLLQPSRRSRIGRNLRQSQERRIPGEPSVPTEPPPEEFPPAGDFYPDAFPEAAPVEEAGGEEEESRTVAYRPPARNVEAVWSGAHSGPVTDFVPPGSRPLRWRLPLMLFLLGLGLGGGAGYGFAGRGLALPVARGPRPEVGPDTAAPLSPYAALPPATLAAVTSNLDGAFAALRAGKFPEADASLRAAQELRPVPPGARVPGTPAGWPELEVERARVRFYAGDLSGADKALDNLLRAPGTASARADALLLRALVQGAQHAPAQADELFAAAVTANPARADIFFFWGNALRTEGKPAESIPKFQAALARNQFETMDGLIRLKLWSSQFQVDTQAPEAAAAVDAALAPPNVPTGYAWMGAAARAIRAGRFADAAGSIRKARPLLEAVIFRVVLSDPMFAEQNWRPELAEFFR